jgi:hypothetical protein
MKQSSSVPSVAKERSKAVTRQLKESKRFFFEKKNQKTFASCGRWHRRYKRPQ